jgi:hypothetical protein
MDATVNKNLINDEISLRLIKQSGPDIPPQPHGMPKWFKEWSDNVFKPTINDINTRLDQMDARMNQNGLAILKIEKRLDQNGLKPLIKRSK